MERVLIASSADWTGVARLPSTLASAGFAVDLLDRGATRASASSRVGSSLVSDGPIDELVARLLEVAPRYDRVIACDETLVSALAACDDPRSVPVLPARRDAVGAVIDKTLFPAAATAAGVRVPRSFTAANNAHLEDAVRSIGAPMVVKGRVGVGGAAVRRAADGPAAAAVARSTGYPVVVQEALSYQLCLMPCLFEHGRLLAAFAASKTRTVKRFGPSSVNTLRAVDDGLRRTAERAGEAFGLHGFASIDYFDPGDGTDPIVIEINPRPVPQLHLGARVGVDMARALRDAVRGEFQGAPRLGSAGPRVVLFPQELHRLRSSRGGLAGTLRWLAIPGALGDIPWNDPGLVRRHMRLRD